MKTETLRMSEPMVFCSRAGNPQKEDLHSQVETKREKCYKKTEQHVKKAAQLCVQTLFFSMGDLSGLLIKESRFY